MNKVSDFNERHQLFALVRKRLGANLAAALPSALASLIDRLDAEQDRLPLPGERAALREAARTLRFDKSHRAEAVVPALDQRALRCLEAVVADAEGGVAATEELRLLDETEVNEQVLTTELATKTRELAGETYAEFVSRLAWLTGREWPLDDFVPLGSRTLAYAISASLRGLSTHPIVWRRMTPMAIELFAPLLAEQIASTNELMIARGAERWTPAADDRGPSGTPVNQPATDGSPQTQDSLAGDGIAAQAWVPEPEPEPETSVAAAAACAAEPLSPPAEPAPQAVSDVGSIGDTDTEAAMRAVQALAVPLAQSMDAARRLNSSPLSRPTPAGETEPLPLLHPVSALERDAVAFAHSIGELPYARGARQAYFRNVSQRMAEAGAAPGQVAIIDVVSAMFDYVIDDRRLPEAAKPLIWRLQQPSVGLAMLDAGYLGQDRRSMRKLVENIGAITTAFADDMVKGGELYRRLETVVRAVEVVANALQIRSTVISRHVESQYERAQVNVERLVERVANERQVLEATPGRRNRRDYRRRPGREREREVGERVRAELERRFAGVRVPDSARDFVFNVWLRQLRTAALRDGEDSEQFKAPLQVVDDLLWSLDAGERRVSRRALAERIPRLVRLLMQGVKEVGAKDEEYKAFFDELFLVHLRRMQRTPLQGSDTSVRPVVDRLPASEPSGSPEVAAISADSTIDDTAPGPVPVLDQALAIEADTPPTRPSAPLMSDAPPADPVHHGANGPPVPQPRQSSASPAENVAAQDTKAVGNAPGPEQRLLEVLNSLDLSDAPARRRRRELPARAAAADIRRGDWIELSMPDHVGALVKVAWINARRTVVLLVRHPDRKALSMRMADLEQRLLSGRASLLDR